MSEVTLHGPGPKGLGRGTWQNGILAPCYVGNRYEQLLSLCVPLLRPAMCVIHRQSLNSLSIGQPCVELVDSR